MLAQGGEEAVVVEGGGAQGEDEGAQLGGRVPGQLADGVQLLPGPVGVVGEVAQGRARGQADAEQRLGGGVVQLEGDAVALLDDAQLAALLVQPGVLDGEGGVGRQQADQGLVGVGEAGPRLLVGQVEGAHDVALEHDRHAEERPHPRVGRRPPAEPGVGPHVVAPVGGGVAQQGAEESVGLGQGTDGFHQIVAHAHVDELGEPVPGLVGDADGRVTGAHQLLGRRRQPLEHGGHRQVAGHPEHGFADRGQGGGGQRRVGCGRRRVGGHRGPFFPPRGERGVAGSLRRSWGGW